MGPPAGRTRDFQALEQRRREGARLLRRGLPEAEVARRVGVHRQSVNRWAPALAAHGRAGLKHPGPAGRKPRLTGADLRRIERALTRGRKRSGTGRISGRPSASLS